MRAPVFLAAAVLLAARMAGGAPLGLVQAQVEARAHAPESAALLARVLTAAEVTRAAGRFLRSDPVLSGGVRTAHEDAGLEPPSWDLALSIPLDVSGSFRPRGASAAAEQEQAQYDRDDGLRALDEAVATAVADLALAQRLVRRAERIEALHALAARAARREQEVGRGSQLDVDAAELDRAAAQASRLEARGAQVQAQLRLGRLLGRGGGAASASIEVEDPEEGGGVSGGSLGDLMERDPRVRAAQAALRAARLELVTYERLAWPQPALKLSFAQEHHEIPAGSFLRRGQPGLSALWDEQALGLSLSLPLPLFDRQKDARARTRARLAQLELHLQSVRLDVRTELDGAQAALRTATETLAALRPTHEIIERELRLLEKAVQAGALDAVARSLVMRRLEEAGRRADAAVREVRVQRARWLRRTTL